MAMDRESLACLDTFYSGTSYVDVLMCGSGQLIPEVSANMKDVAEIVSGAGIAVPASLRQTEPAPNHVASPKPHGPHTI